jgi:3-deoxy-D-manno-octulosonic-acid transferase
MIAFLLDIVYVVILVLASPWLIFKALRTGKYRAGLTEKFFGTVPARESDRPCVWFHAVSVGEVLLLRRVVAAIHERRPDVEIVISTTTYTGMEVARKEFGEKADGTRSVPATLIYFPLDFSWAVWRAITRIRPDVVALAELELWPNFIAAARRFGSRVAVINGRMSPRSRRGYGRVRFLMRYLLSKIDVFAVQTAEYALRFVEIGAAPSRVHVTGSVKYDAVETDRHNAATERLRELLAIRHDELVWVAGSTADPEEQIVLDAYQRLWQTYPALRLILVPRQRDRFDAVAAVIEKRGHKLVRRSRTDSVSERSANNNQQSAILLIDTLGELSAVWGLADIAFVGGSFAPRGGQNMIEPAGYGSAVTFGPGVWNFQDTVDHLLACGGAVQVATAEELQRQTDSLIRDSGRRRQIGEAARRFVLSQHGATTRTIDILDDLLPRPGETVSDSHGAGALKVERAA